MQTLKLIIRSKDHTVWGTVVGPLTVCVYYWFERRRFEIQIALWDGSKLMHLFERRRLTKATAVNWLQGREEVC